MLPELQTPGDAMIGSNSIEGYDATVEDADAIAAGEEPIEVSTETALAFSGYRDAMTYVLQMAADEHAVLDEGQLKALHFMMLKHDLAKHPGQWRPGAIFVVRREETGQIVYEGPQREDVPALITAMLAQIGDEQGHVLVRAAMAHLNLVPIHPFSDGNGRLARCLQTLVLARERIVSPVFAGIEEYLGENTQAYYDVLAAVGQGAWHPETTPGPGYASAWSPTIAKRRRTSSACGEARTCGAAVRGSPRITDSQSA